MDDLKFPNVPILGPRSGEHRLINSVNAALAFMLEHWLGETGPKRQIALDALESAIAGNVSAEDARTAFLYAADEAGILEPLDNRRAPA
ncbi:DUF982 domain-containing protein [Phyllobacterium endophyticum]|uniref:DUF982 domain-containing protein n=1 Tax=Phyllobacterium endophyticum TaxID=1149773 RepID=A0A2P7AR73_9HYPH|nr:DUF982 domain-containing protein [Phyllobacterium endophyticum]MBB3237384.1 hypothetical protein [Phyllobacterium endophyticum]PSH56728.1 hypothetical protein CU100_15375 [Phyllobacterium endophyticum]TYR44288.1 DUF982 domain-containing protein [Phyllobacterium endophyticum]